MISSSSSSSSRSAVANAVGGKTARACDSCVRKRARWYCAADDAFLCQSCDSSVHSANPLARRHHRLRLNSASSPAPPSWLAGFTRKPRTPRRRPKHDLLCPLPLVPEADEATSPGHDHDDPLLCCRVPTDDCSGDFRGLIGGDLDDLEEFAADVETLLGRNLESECFDMDKFLDDMSAEGSSRAVKIEEEDGCRVEQKFEEAEVDPMRHGHQFHLHDAPAAAAAAIKNEITQQQEEHRYVDESNATTNGNKKKRKLRLRLDCEAVIAAWGTHKSPWTAGERPDFLPDDDWPDCMAIWYGQACGQAAAAMGDGGREARVSRYREKRRTRLFSKKIRYEVRKLNAEKRPRMKGRFVKRTPPQPFAQANLPILAIK